VRLFKGRLFLKLRKSVYEYSVNIDPRTRQPSVCTYMRQVLTKDSVTVSVDAVVYYRVSGAIVSVANVENAHHSTRLLAQTTLRNVLGTKDLSEILSEREYISNSMQVLAKFTRLRSLSICRWNSEIVV